jgi:hypothetical protein
MTLLKSRQAATDSKLKEIKDAKRASRQSASSAVHADEG